MNEDQARADLQVIRKLVEQTRLSAGEHWVPFFIWGIFGVFAAAISHYQILTQNYEQIAITWNIYWPVCLGLTIFYQSKKCRQARKRSFVDRSLCITWIGIMITMSVLIASAAGLGVFHPKFIPGVIAFILGAGVLISGGLLEFPPLYFSAAIWWIGGFFMILFPSQAFLVEAGLLLGGYIFPAYLLRRKFLEEKEEANAKTV